MCLITPTCCHDKVVETAELQVDYLTSVNLLWKWTIELQENQSQAWVLVGFFQRGDFKFFLGGGSKQVKFVFSHLKLGKPFC